MFPIQTNSLTQTCAVGINKYKQTSITIQYESMGITAHRFIANDFDYERHFFWMRLILIRVFALVFNLYAFMCMVVSVCLSKLKFLFHSFSFFLCFSFNFCAAMYIYFTARWINNVKVPQTGLHERLQVNKHTLQHTDTFFCCIFFNVNSLWNSIFWFSSKRTHTNSYTKLDQIDYFMFIDCSSVKNANWISNVHMLMISLVF